jgi:hypothetical protein
MYSSKIIILFILTIGIASSHEIYTKTQLRGLHQHHINKLLGEEIQRIVERVVLYAQLNHTSYTHVYRADSAEPTFSDQGNQSLLKLSDEKILTRLQSILIDAVITISEPKCCNSACDKTNINNILCKFIVFNW